MVGEVAKWTTDPRCRLFVDPTEFFTATYQGVTYHAFMVHFPRDNIVGRLEKYDQLVYALTGVLRRGMSYFFASEGVRDHFARLIGDAPPQ